MNSPTQEEPGVEPDREITEHEMNLTDLIRQTRERMPAKTEPLARLRLIDAVAYPAGWQDVLQTVALLRTRAPIGL